MKKRIFAVLAAALMIFTTACGSAATGTGSGPAAPAKSGGEVTLKYACWNKDQLPVYESLFREFEAANPGIKVVSELTSWKEYWTKLETGITGNNAPDIFWLNIPRATDYIANGVILPLDDLNFERDKFPGAHLEAYTRGGVLYGVPKDFDTMGLWYNKEIFDNAGVAYPTDSWTWADLKENAAKLTDESKGIYGMCAPLTWQGGYYETIFQAGGYAFSEDGKKSGFDDPKTIAGVQYWADFTLDGSAPPMEVMSNTTGQDIFDTGKTAMFIEGSYLAPELFINSENKDKYDVAMLPKGETYACTSNALAHVIYAKTAYPAEAMKLIEFLSTKDANVKVAESGVVIPSYIGSQDAWVNSFVGKNAKAFIDILPYIVPLPNAPNSSAAIAIEGEILTKAWNKQISVEEACKEVAAKATAILNG